MRRARCDQRYGACPLRSARRRLRPLGRDPLVRAGSALAALPDPARARRRRRARARRRHRHGRDRARLVRRYGCRVVGVDQSPQMLDGARDRIARAGLADRIELRLGSAETLDFAEARSTRSRPATCCATSTIRCDDARPAALVRPGAPFALLDFAVPPNAVARGALAPLHGRRPAHARAPRLAGLGRGRPLPAAEHHGLRRRLPAGRPARAAGRGRRRRRARAAA